MTTALLVRQPLRPEHADDAAALVVDHARSAGGDGVAALVPAAGVETATLFIERGDRGPALWWYLEPVAGGDELTDPAAAVRESPLFDAGLEAHVDDDRPTRTFGPDRPDSLLVVHASHPDRPARYRTGADGVAQPDGEWTPAVVLAGDGPTDVPEVALVRWRLRRGPATWFMRGFARFANWVDDDGWLEQKLTAWSEPVLEEEEMWTESGFLERGGTRAGGGTSVLVVMEMADMEGVYGGFYRTDNLVARVSERVLGWVIENPARALRYEALETEFDALVHAVDPGRE